ncbi:hypothetical protein B0H14DRAFT_3696886 [Mycena olivaceomarginata]|nr:hypothetical protein B0H14DRAFT_3696886 [Mycena olivaceomarginata]
MPPLRPYFDIKHLCPSASMLSHPTPLREPGSAVLFKLADRMYGSFPLDVDRRAAPLHYNFKEAGDRGGEYDLRAIWDGTVVQKRPIDAVTLVENHEYVSLPFHVLFHDTECVLRPSGYPCVFWGDLYGTKGDNPILAEHKKHLCGAHTSERDARAARGARRAYVSCARPRPRHGCARAFVRTGTRSHIVPTSTAAILSRTRETLERVDRTLCRAAPAPAPVLHEAETWRAQLSSARMAGWISGAWRCGVKSDVKGRGRSQLTYHGLFHLATTLPPGVLVTLFHNSHLSVLHKPASSSSGDQSINCPDADAAAQLRAPEQEIVPGRTVAEEEKAHSATRNPTAQAVSRGAETRALEHAEEAKFNP